MKSHLKWLNVDWKVEAKPFIESAGTSLHSVFGSNHTFQGIMIYSWHGSITMISAFDIYHVAKAIMGTVVKEQKKRDNKKKVKRAKASQ